MSLDVSLIVEEPIKKRGTGVFVRDGGKTMELTPDEVLDKWPDAEVQYNQYETNEVFTANITHNLNKMAEEAGIYIALWRPEERNWKLAEELIEVLAEGLAYLKERPEHFKTFNPDNGWGTYEILVDFTENYLQACKDFPKAVIEVSR